MAHSSPPPGYVEAAANLSRNVRDMRKQRGLTQLALSKRAGVSRNEISNIENNRNSAYMTTIYRLADALSVNAVELLGLSRDE